MGIDQLEKRSIVERKAPQKRGSRANVKETAAKIIQKALPKAGGQKTQRGRPKKGEAVSNALPAALPTPSQAETVVQEQKPRKQQGTPKKQAVAKQATAKTPKKEKTEKPKPQEKVTTKSAQTGGRGRRRKEKEQRKPPLRVIPLGGLGEVGKNMTLYDCQGDMFLIDCGMTFPDDDMLGVDLVLPDFTYAVKNRDRLRGIVITHGHEDHIGALPFFLKQVNVPVFATRLTIALIENKLKEHGLYGKVKMIQIASGETIKLGCMEVEFIRVNHSIPDAVALAIHTPAGVIVHTGDFKVDYTPITGEMIDLARLGELGSRGVLALFSDSTNAERPGFTPTERIVGESLDKLFKQAKNRRIIVATFSSNINRIQQIVDAAAKYKRKVAVSGRSMVNVVGVAVELGYLKPPKGVLIDIDEINRYPQEQLVLVTTGSQGEPMSALSRMATSDHRKVTITPNDFIIISATPIPGNEKTVGRVINGLMKLGAEVIYERMYEIHVSGHACQEELKIMLSLTRPKFFFPVHGEYKQLKKHANLALSMGICADHIFIGENGRVFELDGVSVKAEEFVPAGRVLVDGLGVGDVGSIVLRDRKHLGEDGLIVVVTTMDSASGEVVAGPDIISRGFVYVREAEEMLNEAQLIARQALERCRENHVREWGDLKGQVRDALSSYFYSRTKRSPMILPIIQEV
ncbi:MAG: ribonuclease J [Anaerotruncus sp.]|nr:ribonuclease J [Anaerotruncus sp.]